MYQCHFNSTDTCNKTLIILKIDSTFQICNIYIAVADGDADFKVITTDQIWPILPLKLCFVTEKIYRKIRLSIIYSICFKKKSTTRSKSVNIYTAVAVDDADFKLVTICSNLADITTEVIVCSRNNMTANKIVFIICNICLKKN